MENVIQKIIGLIILVIVLITLLYYFDRKEAPIREVNNKLAQCLNDNGAKFYGAFWCSHCNRQKSFFGKAKEKLPYIECSTPDTKGRTEICIEKEIKSYPTWEFNGGIRCGGVVHPLILAHIANCELPNYTDEELTTKEIYEELVVKNIEEAIRQQNITEEDLQEALEIYKNNVLEGLNRFNKTLETATKEELITVISVVVNECKI